MTKTGEGHESDMPGSLRRTAPSLGILLCLGLMVRAPSVSAQTCTGFPWTVTAASEGGGSTVRVRICGTASGCEPHDPQAFVSGSEIRVYLTQAEPPDCMCVAVEDPFAVDVLVPNVAPGDYTINVVTVSCGQQTPAGTTTFTQGATAVPTLDAWGIGVLGLLLLAAAVWRLH